ncbi:hypothetical protein BV25DRAFT_1916927 [Artomyces pyxidatus]|uniref:Uncharacterized protein n=1 Tax=Artomyces pyxidatus TaxID=48021 RepID=A0ACB8SYM5_9AGAM|nr:hypothetical protein BV25DRAFT_1916927 [Artomyces pyxidatus]
MNASPSVAYTAHDASSFETGRAFEGMATPNAPSLEQKIRRCLRGIHSATVPTQRASVRDVQRRLRGFMLSLSHALRTLHDAHAECLTQSPTVHDGAPMDAILRYIHRVETHVSAFKDPGGEGGGLSNYPSVVTEHHLRLLRGDHELLSRDPPSELRQGLVAEAGALLTVLLAVMAEYNVLSPISRLPPELVVLIIQECAAAHVWDGDVTLLGHACNHNRTVGRADAPWRAATTFCRAWWHTSRDTPPLWNRVSLATGPSFAAMSILRAQNVPLELDVPLCNLDTAPHELSFVVSHICRARRLAIGTATPLHPLALPPAPAPLLEELLITRLGGAESIIEKAPRLRYLTARRCPPLPWPLPGLQRLISLEIEDVTLGPGSATVATVAAAIQAMPALKRLSLHNAFQEAGHGPTPEPVPPPTSMPNLASLCLRDDAPFIAEFLSLIRPATKASITLTPLTNCDVSTLRTIISTLPAASQPGTVDYWGMIATEESGVEYASFQAASSDSVTLMFVSGLSREERWDHLVILDAMRGAFPTRCLRVLTMLTQGGGGPEADTSGVLTPQRWRASLAAAGSLTSLTIYPAAVPSLLPALDAPTPGPSPPEAPFLPQLRQLAVRGEGGLWGECAHVALEGRGLSLTRIAERRWTPLDREP